MISKGVYLIGVSSLTTEERLLNHYLHNDFGECGTPTREYLLFQLGIIDIEPAIITIKSNRIVGTKNICNFQVSESHSVYMTV